MPLLVLGIAGLARALLGLPPAEAVLLAGILAPTDPVLASAVQVGTPGVGGEDEVRFALTPEAGLNEGLAFPFVSLGLLVLARGPDPTGRLGGLAAGRPAVEGRRRGRDRPPPRLGPRPRERPAARALPARQLGRRPRLGRGDLPGPRAGGDEGGYGFVAALVTAATLRTLGRSVGYARELARFAGQAERLAMVMVLALFGATLAGGLLTPLTRGAAFAALVLLAVRPLATLARFLGLGAARAGAAGARLLRRARAGVAVLRRLRREPRQPGAPRRPVGGGRLVVLESVVLCGVSTDPVMRLLERR